MISGVVNGVKIIMNKQTFVELEQEYQTTRNKLTQTLEKLAHFVSNVDTVYDHLFPQDEYINNNYDVNSVDKYEYHYLDKDYVVIGLIYKDAYDVICDYSSCHRYPLKWVEHAYNDTLDEIVEEIAQEILTQHKKEYERAYNEAKRMAIQFGIVKE